MRTSFNFIYSDDGPVVYFEVDVKELFNLNLDEAGIYSALQEAFQKSKEVVPVATGLMKKSYTFKRVNSHTVRCFFDPEKLLDKMRLGRKVDTYYPAYLKNSAKRYNWLDIVMKKFYDSLKTSIKERNKRVSKKTPIDLSIFLLFLDAFNTSYKKKLKEAIKEREKKKEENK